MFLRLLFVRMVSIRTSDCTASQLAYARRDLLTGPSNNTARLLRSAEGQELLTGLRADLAARSHESRWGVAGAMDVFLLSCDKFVVLKDGVLAGVGGLLSPQRWVFLYVIDRTVGPNLI